MRYLIDTNSCIFLFANGNEPLKQRIATTPRHDIGLSAVVFAELALGVQLGRPPTRDALERLVQEMPILPFDEGAARAYSTLPFRRGRIDRLLAAHALSLDMAVITNNERDFADVPGLRIENWTL